MKGYRDARLRSTVRELIETVILALVIFLALQFSVQNYRVEGPSMDPTLHEGQFLFVNKLVYLRLDLRALADRLPFVEIDREDSMFPFHSPSRGEILIFRFPNDTTRDFVKRVIGLPGDTVEIKRGTVFVNGEELDEPYVVNADNRSMAPFHVDEESYFVLGDNRRSSNDSRDWAPIRTVPMENIIGRAWVRFWPLDTVNILQSFGIR